MRTMTEPGESAVARPLLDAAGRTDRGLVRPGNEDSLWCGTRAFAVADGVGGHPAGEVASALALEPLAELDDGAEPDDDVAAALADAVRRGARRVHDDAAANPGRAGMATTVTAAAVAAGRVHIAHVGDSRVYRWRSGTGLERLTTDHTPAEQAALEGRLTWEEAEAHPQRHMLLRVLGTAPDVELDMPEPVEFAAGDRLLLCTDGLTGVVEPATIGDVLARSDDAAAAADALVEAALAGGGPDNVTVVVVAAG